MLSFLFDFVAEYVKEQRYWKILRPITVAIAVFAGIQLLLLQYLKFQYNIAPSISLYFRSYFFQGSLIAFCVCIAVVVAFRLGPLNSQRTWFKVMMDRLQMDRAALYFRTATILIAVSLLTLAAWRLLPGKSTDVAVKFRSPIPDARPDVLAYLIYELNRRQQNWYFRLDLQDINPDKFQPDKLAECERGPDVELSIVEHWASLNKIDTPVIALTSFTLGKARFYQHRNNISVVSTADRNKYLPISDYEYLVFNIIVQGIALHLNQRGITPSELTRNFSRDAESTGATQGGLRFAARGGIFEFDATGETYKSMILAASLSPEEEMVIFNTLGPDYLRSAKEMLSLKWMRTPEVTSNLKNYFNVELAQPGT